MKPLSSQIPPLEVIHGIHPIHGSGYKVTGWEEFDRWAQMNVVTWKLVTKEVEQMGLNEQDRLRWLAHSYLRSFHQMAEEYADYRFKNPAPVIGPDGKVWRYIGP